jgi:hypothetical protein
MSWAKTAVERKNSKTWLFHVFIWWQMFKWLAYSMNYQPKKKRLWAFF